MLISNKLISLLSAFSKHELNSFKKFVNSPFHNENQELIQLFDIIDCYLRSTEKEQRDNPLEKQKVWKVIYNKKPYKDVRLRRICSDLIKLAYSFLAYTDYQKNHLSEQLNLMGALSKPDLQKHFENAYSQAAQLLEKNPLRNADYHLSAYTVNTKVFYFPKDLGSKKKLFVHLEKGDYYLECFYIIKKLENYCAYISYKNVIAFDAEIMLPPSFIEYIENSDCFREPAVRAYYLVTKMLLEPQEEAHFFDLKKHLEDNRNRFTLQELDLFYIHLKNYCIDTKINKGRTDYFNKLFEIFQTLLTEKIIFKNGMIPPQSYKNIVTVGLYIKEYDWVENFIQTYTVHLPKEHRENALTYNLAKVYISQKKYDKVIEQLREVEYKNHVYALGGKLILLKTYYELQEYQPLDSLIDSFRIYIRRNKIISREVKQQYLNMLRFVKKLSGTIVGDKKSIEKIRSQIDKCKALAGKKWILEKVEELV